MLEPSVVATGAAQTTDLGNTIYLRYLDHPRHVSRFISAVNRILRAAYPGVIVDATDAGRAFPNACVPITAIIQLLRDRGLQVDVRSRGFPDRARFGQPLPATPQTLAAETDPISRVWLFQDEKMVNDLVTALSHSIMERIECGPGVMESFEWSLNEVMDNVLQHSQASAGYAMVQVHAATKRLAICVADFGLGIYGTLAQSVHKPRSAVDAITMAVKEGVTRDTKIGQGNGLWGLLQIVENNDGRLHITSGEGALFIRGRGVQTFSPLPFIDTAHRGTIVDFQIDANRPIDIAGLLRGHKPVNPTLESLETDTGEHLIRIRDHAHGTGTRRAAQQIRNIVTNILNEGASRIILDFSGVAIVSSSFADEFIGKLVVRYGFVGFQSLIHLRNMNEAVQGIVHRSVAQRMMEGIQDGQDTR